MPKRKKKTSLLRRKHHAFHRAERKRNRQEGQELEGASEHHKKKQQEKEMQEREEALHSIPITPSRQPPQHFTQGSPRFPSPRQQEPFPMAFIRASPGSPLRMMRHELYPRPMKRPLNFDQQGLNQHPPRMPVSGQVIKIEAEEPDENISMEAPSGGDPMGPAYSKPLSPSHTPLATPVIPEPSEWDDDARSTSFTSTIPNEASDLKLGESAPAEGLSLDSDLSSLLPPTEDSSGGENQQPGTPSKTPGSSSGLDSCVNVKVEAITESEMELEIMGVELGPSRVQHANSQEGWAPSGSAGAMGYSDGAAGSQADMQQGHTDDINKILSRFFLVSPEHDPQHGPIEAMDSDGFYANEFWVILDKPYKYTCMDNLDEFVVRERAKQFSAFKQGCSDIASEVFTNVKSNSCVRFVSLYDDGIPKLKLVIIVQKDFSVRVSVNYKWVSDTSFIWDRIPRYCSSSEALEFILKTLESLKVCAGNDDEELQSLVPPYVLLETKEGSNYKGYRDVYLTSTVRSTECSLLFEGGLLRCKSCATYRKTLQKLLARKRENPQESTSQRNWLTSTVNNSKLSENQKLHKLNQIKTQKETLEKENLQLKKSIKQFSECLPGEDSENLVQVSDDVDSDMTSILPDKKRRTGEKRHNCGLCGKTFSTRSQAIVHLRKHTGETPFKCNTCGEAFRASSSLRQHIRKHTDGEVYKCETCGKVFGSSGVLARHTMIHTGEKPYKCKLCGKSFRLINFLLQHRRTHSGERACICEICGQTFRGKVQLASHMKKHTGKKIHTCKVCGKAFRTSSELAVHTRIHTGERPFKCETCGQTFRIIANLRRHKRIHTGEKPYKCKICGKMFGEKQSVTIHMRVHTGEKNCRCEVCGQAFGHKGHLNRHMRKHTGEKNHICENCGEAFSRKDNLAAHLDRHTREKKRRPRDTPCNCEVCGTTFKTNLQLTEHMVLHTGEKPFQCTICGNKFGHKCNLYRHMREHSGEKTHMCETCGKAFKRKENLAEHLKIHTKENKRQITENPC